MDALKKALLGSVARGILWAAGAVSAMVGIENMEESTALGLGGWALALLFAGVGLLWSRFTQKKLAEAPSQ